MARRLATENFVAFAAEGLTSAGGYPGNDEAAAKLAWKRTLDFFNKYLRG